MAVIDNIADKSIVIGRKQCKRAAGENAVDTLYVALDADEKVTRDVVACAQDFGAKIIEVPTMSELGKACKIDVGASLVALLKKPVIIIDKDIPKPI